MKFSKLLHGSDILNSCSAAHLHSVSLVCSLVIWYPRDLSMAVETHVLSLLPWQLSAGFAIAEAAPVTKTEALAKCLRECTEYVVNTCGRGMSTSKLERLCEVISYCEFFATISWRWASFWGVHKRLVEMWLTLESFCYVVLIPGNCWNTFYNSEEPLCERVATILKA